MRTILNWLFPKPKRLPTRYIPKHPTTKSEARAQRALKWN